MNLKLILSTIVITQSALFAQSDSSFIEFKTQKLLCAPFYSSVNEPRLGLGKSIQNSDMMLNIGNGLDLLRYKWNDENKQTRTISAGIDFFTFAKVVGWEGLRLQVDAVDGFFGGHMATIIPLKNDAIQLRFRFLHLSGHYVDGHYDLSDSTWKNGREPIPFTRDMGDLSAAYAGDRFRIYALVEHAFRIRPFNQYRTWYEGGFEWYFLHSISYQAFVSQDVKLIGWDSYKPAFSSMIGWTFGEKYGSGLTFYIKRYSGPGPYSEYIDVIDTNVSLGFSVDYW